MKYAMVLFGSVLLAGCATSNFSDVSSSKNSPTPVVMVVKPFVGNPNILALNAQLLQSYAGSQVQVLRVGNEVKVTYPSDVLFGVGGEELSTSSQAMLDPLVNAVKAYPQASLRIDSFTDKSGSPEKNITRSEQRAQSVASYLIHLGFAASNISLKGYGSGYPVADNSIPEGRALNRHIVITVSNIPVPPTVV